MKLKILIVEDDFSNRKLLKDTMTHLGHAVTSVADGEEAINVLQKDCSYDLIITDYRMPRKNGLEVVEFVRRNYPATKIIMLSADNFNDQTLRDAGVNKFLPKPFSLKALRHAITELFH